MEKKKNSGGSIQIRRFEATGDPVGLIHFAIPFDDAQFFASIHDEVIEVSS